MTTWTKAEVEAVAKAIYEQDPWTASLERGMMTGSPYWRWEDLPDGDQEEYAKVAKAALEALYSLNEGE